MRLWRTSKKRLLLNSKGFLWRCSTCPCDCEPKVIASQIVNNNPDSGYPRCWELSEYQGDGIGSPGHKWRLIETGACLRYGLGDINENGKLVGLQSQFCSNYWYNGYMELQQGCVQKDGSIKWLGRCG